MKHNGLGRLIGALAVLALWLLVGSASAEGHTHEGWTGINGLPTVAGNYYLTGTVWLRDIWTAPQGVTNLCLNGKTITKSSSAGLIGLIKVPSGATLNLYDEAGNEGKITGGDYTGGAIFISGGTFNMFGGQITGNVGADAGGGGVYLASSSSVFNMHDGVISNNRTSSMTGSGGGVLVNKGQFTMSGGSITGNQSDGRLADGGGVSVYGGTFTMTGGSITGNSATQGGGVYNRKSFNVSGTAIIKDNTANGAPDNIKLVSIYKISVTGALADGAEIHVKKGMGETAAQPGGGYTLTESDAAKFHSDTDATLDSVLTDGNVIFRKRLTDGMVTLKQETTVEYTGSAISPVTVTDGSKTLVLGKDYTVNVRKGGTSVDEIKDLGAYTFNSVTGTGAYWGTVSVDGTFTVIPASVTLTANSGAETYDGTEKTVSGFMSSVEGLTFDGVSASGSGTNAGEYDVTFSGVSVNDTKDSTGNYIVTSTTDGKLTINPASVTLTANSRNTDVYDGTAKTVTGFTSSVEGLTFVGVSAGGNGTNAGEYDVTFTGVTVDATKDSTGNYVVTSTTDGKLTINPASVTLTANSRNTDVYDGTEKTVTGFSPSVTSLSFDGVNASGSGTDAGEYDVTFTGVTVNDTKDSTGNYVVTATTDGKLTINPASVTLTANSGAETYDGTEKTVTGFSSSIAGLSFDGVSAGGSGTDAGEYDVAFTGVTVNDTKDSTGNYMVTAATNGKLIIYKAKPADVTAPTPDAVTYDSAKTLADVALPEGWAWVTNTIVPTVVNSGYDVALTVDDANYDYTDVEGYDATAHTVTRNVTLTVNKAAPTVTTPTAKAPIYTGSAQELVNAGSTNGGTLYYAVTAEDKAPTDESLYTPSIPTATNAGTYYVWYRVKGDDNHTDSAASTPVAVTIRPVNKDALNEAIRAAEAYYDEIKGNADYAAIAEALKRAIDAAKRVADNNNATADQVSAAISSVTEAEKTAKASVQAADEAAAKQAADKAAAKAVADAIMALSDNAGTGDKDAVAAARAAYEALTDEQKKLVPAEVLSKLTTAEASVKAAEEAEAQQQAEEEEAAAKQAADEAAAKAVADAIMALNDNAGTGDKDAVAAARAAYEALTEDQKKLITEDVLARLTTAEQQVQEAEEAAESVDIADCKITVKNQTYTGKALEPAVTVKYGETTLKQETDYTVAYRNNRDVGTATVTVKGKGNCTGTGKATFKIVAVKLAKCAFAVKDQVYTGKALKPAVTVKYGKVKLTKGTDYTVAYKNNRKIGLATVTVKGKGNYTGSKKVVFRINPKGTAFTTLTGGNKKITLKWKNPKNINGYQIEYSLKKDLSGSKKLNVKKAKTLTTTLRKLKANKTYYVRIRTYARVNKKNYFSAWSKVKAVKTRTGKTKNDFAEPDLEIAMSAGEALALEPLVSMDASDGEPAWATSDAAVATVSPDGVVNALKPGDVVITATGERGRIITVSIRVDEAEELTLTGLEDDGLLPDIDDSFDEVIVMENGEIPIGIEAVGN